MKSLNQTLILLFLVGASVGVFSCKSQKKLAADEALKAARRQDVGSERLRKSNLRTLEAVRKKLRLQKPGKLPKPRQILKNC